MSKNTKFNVLLNKKGTVCAFLSCVLVFCVTGCADSSSHKMEPIEKEMYQKALVDTVTVQKGDIFPELNIALEQTAYVYYNYSIDMDNLEFESLNVSVGDYVKAGTVLVSFKSEKLQKEYNEKNQKLEQNKLLLEHVKKLKGIVESTDTSKLSEREKKDVEKKIKSYSDSIIMLEDDIKLKSVEVAEKKRQLDACTIKAKEDGTITFIKNTLINGIAEKDTDLITQACGKLEFYASVKESEHTFKIGETYDAKAPTIQCQLVVTDIIDKSEGVKEVWFKPVDEEVVYVNGEKFEISIEQTSLNNVVYVEERAIFTDLEDREYVIVVSEEGYRELRYVKVSSYIDGKAVIESGVSEGEEVALK